MSRRSSRKNGPRKPGKGRGIKVPKGPCEPEPPKHPPPPEPTRPWDERGGPDPLKWLRIGKKKG